MIADGRIMRNSRVSRRVVGQVGILFAIQVTQAAAFADVSLYEPFNYSAPTLLEGQSPDGIRTWSVAGGGLGDATTGRPHAVTGNLSMPSPMPIATGNECNYGSLGAGTRIDLSGEHTQLMVNGLTLYYSYALQVTDTGGIGTGGQIITSFIQPTG